MPQTREHFEIVRLLGLTRGVVAVTKIDRASPELVEVTRSDVRELTRGSFLEDAADRSGLREDRGGPRGASSGAPGAGAARSASRQWEARAARLPIDRAFLIAGFGPVVTGSLVSGTITPRAEAGASCRSAGSSACAASRCTAARRRRRARASGSAPTSRASSSPDLRRGLVLAPPGALPPSTRLLVRLDLLSDAPPHRERRSRLASPLFVRDAGTDAPARIALGSQPGSSARVQLRLARPRRGGSRRPFHRAAALAGPDDRRRRRPRPAPAGRARRAGRRGESPRSIVSRREPRRSAWSSGSSGARARRGRGGSRPRAGVSAPAVREALSLGDRRSARPRAAALSRSLPLGGRAGDAWQPRRRRCSRSCSRPTRPRSACRAARCSQRLLPGADARWAEAIEAALVARGVLAIAGEEARAPGRDDLASPSASCRSGSSTLFRERGLDPPSPAEVAHVALAATPRWSRA